MQNTLTLQIAEPTTAPARFETNPPQRILVVDADLGTRPSSIEVPIRHEISSSLNNTFMKCKQNQPGYAAAERQL